MGKATTALNAPNQTGYFYPADENWVMRKLPMLASVAMAEGVAIQAETSTAASTGYYRTMVAVGNIAGDDFCGILAEPILATDADFATAGKLKGVRMPTTPEAEAYCYIGAGTFTTTDVGQTCRLHTDFKSVDVDVSGVWVTITGYISSTKGICKFNFPKTQMA